MKTNNRRIVNSCLIAGLGMLAILALMHWFDVNEGVIESGHTWLRVRYLAVAAAGTAAAAVSGILLAGRRLHLEYVFALAALSFGLLYLYVLPPLSAPDEIRHYISAYRLSNRIMGVYTDDPAGRVVVRVQDWFAEDSCQDYQVEMLEDGTLAVQENGAATAKILGQTLTEETYRLIHDYASGHSYDAGQLAEDSGTGTEPEKQGIFALSAHDPVVTTPCAYLMPALGITLARALNRNTLWLLYLGRIFNLLLFIAAVSAAIRRIPFGKEVLFGVGILPMTLHLAASYSYDAFLIAGFCLFTAICMDLAYRAEKVCWTDILLLSVIMAAAGPCKMVYAVFSGLCLLIPVKKFGGWGRWAVSAACVLGAWIIAMILINSGTVASYASETDNYISWAGESGYSMALILHRPLNTLRMIFRTVVWQSELWHLSMIGMYLGNLDPVLDVPYLVVLGLTGGLLVLSFRKPGEQMEIRPLQKGWIWFLCLVCTGALMLSMFLAWTPLSSKIICGVQGRYFLPFLPVFLLTMKNNTIVLTKNPDRSILYVMCCADSYVVMRIFSIVCMRL